MDIKIGFIGGGHMTTNFLAGLIGTQMAQPEDIYVFDRNEPKRSKLASRYGVNISRDNDELISNCKVVFLSVKPQGMQDMIHQHRQVLIEYKPLIVSLAAGIHLQSFADWLNDSIKLVRVMPNMPSSVGLGASGMLANDNVSEQDKEQVRKLVDSVGISAWVDSDADIDAITALSGSSPAYFMLFAQHLAGSAKASGIDAEDAKAFAVQTMLGTAKLIASSDESLDELITGIQTKGGTTEQAVLSFKRDNLDSVVERAFNAARDRAAELAK